MNLKQLRNRLDEIALHYLKRDGGPLDPEVWVSVQISPKRKVYVPIKGVWTGPIPLPLPDDNRAGYKEGPRVVEVQTDSRDKVTVKN